MNALDSGSFRVSVVGADFLVAAAVVADLFFFFFLYVESFPLNIISIRNVVAFGKSGKGNKKAWVLVLGEMHLTIPRTLRITHTRTPRRKCELYTVKNLDAG